jgi:nucleolar GTP-binding protein
VCPFHLTPSCCSIKPLFANKPLLIVVNKTDVRPVESLGPEEQQLLQQMETEARRISSGGG